MSEFLVPYGYGEAEFIEKRSKFTGRVWLCETEQEALEHIAEMRSRYWDAAHNVYAYSIREGGATRFSDDGEPQGTAGMPVLDVFRREGISNFLCVVTRYFGGVLLGAGGLVRAYAHTAKIALDAAGTAVMKPVMVLRFTCPYHLFDRVKAEIEFFEGIIRQTDYSADIQIHMHIPELNYNNFNERINEMSSGLIKPELIEVRHLPIRNR